MAIEQANNEITNVYEKKLVEESDIEKSRYSPLCRQVSYLCNVENQVMRNIFVWFFIIHLLHTVFYCMSYFR